MLCVHTIRRLKPGTFDEFEERFTPKSRRVPAGWVRFHLLRSLEDENEVVTFGFFDGTVDELQRSVERERFGDSRNSIEPLVEEVVANRVYEVTWSMTAEDALAGGSGRA